MTRYSGDQVNIGFGKETTPGTSVAPTYWVPDTDASVYDRDGQAFNTSSFGDIQKNANATLVKQWAEGTIKGIVYRNSFGLILAALFGQTSTDTVVETTAKSHAFTLANNNQHLSLTLAKKDPNLQQRMAMCRIDSLKLNYVVDNYINYEAKYMAKKGATASDTVTYAAETEFVPANAVIKTAAVGTANLGAAAAITNIKSITLTISKNLKETQALGNVDLENIVNTDFEVKGTIERYMDDTTFKDFVFNKTHRSMRIDLIDTNTIVGAVTNPELKFDMDEVVFSNWQPKEGDADVVTETMDFTGLRNFTSAKTIAATLVNDIASY